MGDYKTIKFLRFLVGGLVLSFGATAFSAASVTPKRKKAVDIFDAPKRKASKIGKLKPGTALDAIERTGMYWKVKYKSREAYVSVMKVTRQTGSASSFAKAIRNAAQESRGTDDVANTRARSAVMGVRGLDESDEVSGAGNVSPNLRMVYAMEDLKISQKGVDRIGDLVFSEIEAKAGAE